MYHTLITLGLLFTPCSESFVLDRTNSRIIIPTSIPPLHGANNNIPRITNPHEEAMIALHEAGHVVIGSTQNIGGKVMYAEIQYEENVCTDEKVAVSGRVIFLFKNHTIHTTNTIKITPFHNNESIRNDDQQLNYIKTCFAGNIQEQYAQNILGISTNVVQKNCNTSNTNLTISITDKIRHFLTNPELKIDASSICSIATSIVCKKMGLERKAFDILCKNKDFIHEFETILKKNYLTTEKLVQASQPEIILVAKALIHQKYNPDTQSKVLSDCAIQKIIKKVQDIKLKKE